MASPNFRFIGNITLGLSLLTFAIYFANVVVGGPLGKPRFMTEVGEMLALFIAVILFVAGTLAREAEAGLDPDPEAALESGRERAR